MPTDAELAAALLELDGDGGDGVSAKADCRVAFAETLVALAEADPRIVAVANDSVGSSNLKEFKRRFPDRLVNVGIAEQNLVGVSAGLASAGKIPFTCGASCFLTGRALEQVKVDLAYSRHNVKLCGMSSGMAYGELGPTHHSIEDLAWTRAIANMTVIVPADPVETAQAVRAAAAMDGPVFLRISRMPVPNVHAAGLRLRDRTRGAAARRARTSRSIADRRHGARRASRPPRSLEADGISAAVLNMSTIRPHRPRGDRRGRRAGSDRDGRRTHGATAASAAPWPRSSSTTQPVRMRMLGVPGVFAPTGSTGVPARALRH